MPLTQVSIVLLVLKCALSEAAVVSEEASSLVALHDFCGWSLGWATNVDACEGGPLGFGWDGVECDSSDHHIEKVELEDRELPCNLTGLDDLELFDPTVMTRLISFSILGCGLFGSLPLAFGALPSLTLFNLDNNAIEADLSNYTFASPTLATLRMNRNRFFGEVPSMVHNEHLVELDLSYNQLSGDIVSKLSSNSALVYVDLSGNDFTGQLPVFGTESHLATLKVSNNNFTGSIPNSIGAFGSSGNGLVLLHVNGNQLSGTLPQAISDLLNLEEFDVSDNSLSGYLPDLHEMSSISDSAVQLQGNTFLCPVPSTDLIYDSATCVCGPGSIGDQGAFDGSAWDPDTCRLDNGSLASACLSLSRFNCLQCSGGYFSTAAWSSECSACGFGFFQASASATTCDQCEAGYFAASDGLTSCLECAFGDWSDAGASACVDCAPGFYESYDGENLCDLCPSGQYQPQSAASSCDGVPRGFIGDDCNFGDMGCATTRACAAGFFGAAVNSTECTACAVGWFSSAPGSTVCEQCIPGEFSGANASSGCLGCSPGQFVASFGATSCEACASSHIASSTAATACTSCSFGKYADSEATACLNCPAGTRSSLNTCVPCELGTHQDSAGQLTCKSCEAGQYADSTGQVVCALCPAGTTSNASASQCQRCPAFTISSLGGSCYECDDGYYSSDDQQSCISCSDHQTFVADGEPGRKCNALSTDAAIAIGLLTMVALVATIIVIGAMLFARCRKNAGTSKIVPVSQLIAGATKKGISKQELRTEKMRIMDKRHLWRCVDPSGNGFWILRNDAHARGCFADVARCIGLHDDRSTVTHFESVPFRKVPTSVSDPDFEHESEWQLGFCQLSNFFYFAQGPATYTLGWPNDWPTSMTEFQIVRVLNSPVVNLLPKQDEITNDKVEGGSPPDRSPIIHHSTSHDSRRVGIVRLLGATIIFGEDDSGKLDVQEHIIDIPPSQKQKRDAAATVDRSKPWLELPPLHAAPVSQLANNFLHRMWRRLAKDKSTVQMYV